MLSRPWDPGQHDRLLTVSQSRWMAAIWLFAVAVSMPLAITIAFLLTPVTRSQLPELVLLGGIIVVARLGKFWSAALATAVSTALLRYYFLEPQGFFAVEQVEDGLGLLAFVALSLSLSFLVARERATRDRAEHATMRLSFIDEANDLLGRARLDYAETLDRLARLVVPRVADWCTVEVLDETGRLETVAFAASGAVNPSLVESLRHQTQPKRDARAGVGAVIRTGRSELYSRMDAAALQLIARDGRHLALLRGLKVVSMMKVPLFLKGRPAGALTFASVQRRRRFDESDLTLAEDLAARASSAIENARLYQERVSAARILQRSLLPPQIPQVPGLDLAAHFSPFGQGDLVGGDFYDVFELQDGRWIVVVGDVCGKGVEAAVLTGLARHTLRAGALTEERPSDLLRLLNDAILRQGLDRYCTVAIARITLEQDRVSAVLSAGGHPLPIVMRAGGSAEPVGTPGTLLGVFPEISLTDERVDLAPGDALVLYTDGWLDEKTPDPERALCDELKSVGGLHATAAIERLEQDAEPPTKDDRAMVMVRVRDEGAPDASAWVSIKA